jgi:signal peptidase II
MSCCGIENPFSFNVADIAIFAGALGLVLFMGKQTPPAPRKRRKTP